MEYALQEGGVLPRSKLKNSNSLNGKFWPFPDVQREILKLLQRKGVFREFQQMHIPDGSKMHLK